MAKTGPTSDNGAEYYQGISDALREANEKGGIRGYTIEEQFFDHAYNIADRPGQVQRVEGGPELAGRADVLQLGHTRQRGVQPRTPPIEGKPFISGSYATTLATPTAQSRQVTDAGRHHSRPSPPRARPTTSSPAPTTPPRSGSPCASSRTGAGGRSPSPICTTSSFCKQPIPAGKTYANEIGLGIAPDFVPELSRHRGRHRGQDAAVRGREPGRGLVLGGQLDGHHHRHHQGRAQVPASAPS